jgi:trypsin-like peptidase
VTPRLLLTCAHCVKQLDVGHTVAILYGATEYPATILHKSPPHIDRDPPPWPWPDLAVLDVGCDIAEYLRLVDRIPLVGGSLKTFGFPTDADIGGEEGHVRYEGRAFIRQFDDRSRLKLGGGHIPRGMSGAPLYDSDIDGIVGMITDTSSPTREEGGHATPSFYLVDGADMLRDLIPRRPSGGAPSAPTPETPPSPRATVGSMALDAWAAPTATSATAAKSATVDVVESLADVDRSREWSPHIGAGLDESRQLRRKGRPEDAVRLATALSRDADMRSVPSQARAAVLRELALAMLQARGRADEEVRDLVERARELDPGDARQIILDVEIVAEDSGDEQALLLFPAESIPEIEVVRAGILIRVGQSENAIASIESLPQEHQKDPRTLRLLALAHAGLRHRAEATAIADAIAPFSDQDAQVGFVAAYVFLLGSMPTQYWPRFPWSWPQPFPRDATIEDQAQQGRLRRASMILTDILETSQVKGDERANLMTWKFASVVLDSQRREEAILEARRQIESTSPNYRLVPWIAAFELPIDTTATINGLHQRIESGEAQPEEILVVAADAIGQGDGEGAEQVLRSSHAHFEGAGARSNWLIFLIQALLVQGKIDQAERHATELPSDERRKAELMIAETREGDEAARIVELMRRYAEDRDPLTLLVASGIAYRVKDWAFLADHGESLLGSFGTIETARFAIYGSYNAARYYDALERYAQYAADDRAVPADLVRVRALALERLGDPKASEAFETLIDIEPSAKNFALSGASAVRRGDVATAVVLAQRVADLSDLPAEVSLQFAVWTRLHNRDLSRVLWRRAMEVGIPDELVPTAFMLARQLDVEAEARTLAESMGRLGSEGRVGITMVSQENIVEVLRHQAERASDVFARYRRGELPIHLVCAGTNLDLVRSHVTIPRANAASGAEGWNPIFVRHGGRGSTDAAGAFENRSPFLDVTSYLLAADLGILEEIQWAFSRLYVAPDLAGVLSAEREHLLSSSPSQIGALTEIIQLVDSNRIKIIDETPAKYATTYGGTVCDWAGSENDGAPSLTPRRLVDVLQLGGAIGAADHKKAVEALGNLQEASGLNPIAGSPLVLKWNVPETLAEGGVLGALARRYALVLERGYISHIRNELARMQADEAIADWVRQALETLRTGITKNTIRRVPEIASQSDDAGEVRLATSLVSGVAQDPMFAVVDDRFMSGYPYRGDGTPIVTTYELLGHMRRTGVIGDDRYFEILTEMRRRGLMYIPLSTQEILRHVRRSRIENAMLVPTEELRTLERYICSALLDREAMNATSGAAEGPLAGQAPFLMATSTAIRSAISILADEGSVESHGLANWIRNHLIIDGLPGYGMSAYAPGSKSESAIDVEGAGFIADWIIR